ncbi:hypothetical protein BN424_2083 [Carnobacterium maltaromaticum LMA28]|uniref:Uncharacterized protein n=1 Tax=Carnobacterium maltaromaticum LMA28 TaxID=1234679 RepID=K8E4V3_CARML|nr:hypothetical protein BN424_2083 [Carnobacterium maltaromaticum LMA28]
MKQAFVAAHRNIRDGVTGSSVTKSITKAIFGVLDKKIMATLF